jgi:ketosteroid isomerase-like protein
MKMKNQFTLFLGMITLFLASCAEPVAPPKPLDLEKLKVEIQKLEDAYAAAEKAKDASAVVAYYSDDAISYSRNNEPLSGMTAIKEKTIQRLAEDTTGNYNVYKIVDLFAEGNTAVEIGSWALFSPTGTELEKGHYMSYFQLRNGKYLCVRDMNVTSKPEKEGM